MRIFMAAVLMCVGVVSLSAGGKKPNLPSANSGSTTGRRIAYEQTVSSPTPKPGKGGAVPIQKTVPVEGQDFEFALENRSGYGDGTIPVKMKWIPAGTFQMGSTAATDPDRFNDELQHTVTLTQGYWMMETEVTQAMYHAVFHPVFWPGLAFFTDPKNPRENVSWDDANHFCREIGKNSLLMASNNLSGFEFRLPTEAEWEHACRAGTTTAVYVDYGDRKKELDAIAWWISNSKNATRNVRQKVPNSWGLYDMLGNVEEWCSDRYDLYPSGSVTNPTGPSSGSRRVARGGSWSDGAGWNNGERFVRSACRNRLGPGERRNNLGFRPVLSRVPASQ